MKQIFTVVSFFTLVRFIAAKGPTVNLEYYRDTECASSSLSAVTLSAPSAGCGACTDLLHAGVSFHVGSPASEKQIPDGCEVVGFARKDCRGATNLQIQGPSSEGTCHVSEKNSRDLIYSSQSLRLLCL